MQWAILRRTIAARTISKRTRARSLRTMLNGMGMLRCVLCWVGCAKQRGIRARWTLTRWGGNRRTMGWPWTVIICWKARPNVTRSCWWFVKIVKRLWWVMFKCIFLFILWFIFQGTLLQRSPFSFLCLLFQRCTSFGRDRWFAVWGWRTRWRRPRGPGGSVRATRPAPGPLGRHRPSFWTSGTWAATPRASGVSSVPHRSITSTMVSTTSSLIIPSTSSSVTIGTSHSSIVSVISAIISGINTISAPRSGICPWPRPRTKIKKQTLITGKFGGVGGRGGAEKKSSALTQNAAILKMQSEW